MVLMRGHYMCYLAHLSTMCSWWAIVISLCLASVVNILLSTTSSPKQLDRFWNNFTGRFLGWPSTKIAQTVLLRWTRWPPELKIEKPLNHFCSWTSRWLLKYSLPKLLKRFHYVEQNGRQAINRNKLLMTFSAKSMVRFGIISQEYSLGECLPKLLKPFRSFEQDGH